MKIAVINGPNLNFLGIREPHIYGNETLSALESELKKKWQDLLFFQSNSEGAIIDFLQKCYYEGVEGIVLNPGALTHYSYALADAIKSVQIPTIEVHISNIYKRESFRSHSVTAASCIGSITGLGFMGYHLGVEALQKHVAMQKRL